MHRILVEERKDIKISGVSDIDFFSETKIVLATDMGELTIKGEDLHVISLDAENGELIGSGTVSSLSYSRKSIHDGAVKKLFR